MSLPIRTYTDIFKLQDLEEQGNIARVLGSYHIIPHLPASSRSVSLRALYISPSTKVGLRTENFFPPRLPPHSWLILCFLPQALADKIGIGCSLVRGEYGRAWNEVKLMNESQKGVIGGLPPPEVYIVDLMFHPGGLMKLKSKEADRYRFL